MFEGDWIQEEKLDRVVDDRNYTSLADEFDVAVAAETGAAPDELVDDVVDNEDDLNTVRRRLPTSLADNM